jgi:glutamine phosphoribosylpyrophosphate amidotransferase
VDEIGAFLGVDSIGYLSAEGMLDVVSDAGQLLHRLLQRRLPRPAGGPGARLRHELALLSGERRRNPNEEAG